MQFAEDEIENLFTGTTHILHTTGKAHIVAGVVEETSWDTTISQLVLDPRYSHNHPSSFRPQARARGDDYVNCYSATIGMQQQYHARTYYVLGANHDTGLVNDVYYVLKPGTQEEYEAIWCNTIALVKNILTQGGDYVTLPNRVQKSMP